MAIDRKDTPIPSMQRANPPLSLNLRRGPTSTNHEASPPVTPPYRIRTKNDRASKMHRAHPTPRETYREGPTDGSQRNARGAGGNEQSPNERISHDLSFTENPRHSVVDNMLLSLNPDQPRLLSSSNAKPPQSSGSQGSSTKSLRHRGHLPSSSSASDTTNTVDNSPGRFASHFNRGRRSNSSSNFQSTLGRIDSLRPSEDHGPTRRSNALIAQRAGAVDRSSVPKSSAGRKNSKSSGSSSVDLGQMVGTAKWQNTLHQRSPSSDEHKSGVSIRAEAATAMPKANPQPMRYPSSEVAPTPTIPSGPNNRDPSPAIPARAPHPTQQATFSQHKSSHESLKTYKQKKARGDGTERSGLRTERSKSPEKAHGSQRTEAAQSPKKARGGHRAGSPTASPTKILNEPSPRLRQQVLAQKERPGFFRRVFGSSRSTTASSNDIRSSQPPSTRNSVRVESRTSFAPSHTLLVQGQTDDGLPPSAQRVHPTVAKKPSSFFRRRKKSISELESAPEPLELPPHIAANNATQQSPSLRQVMDPFLHSPSNTKTERSRIRNVGPQFADISKPSYPSQRPPLRHMSSSQRSLQDNQRTSVVPDSHASSTSRLPENLKSSPNVKSDDGQLHPPTDSFLHDNSSTEDRNADVESGRASTLNEPMTPNRTASRSPVDASYSQKYDPRLRGHRNVPTDRTETASGRSTPSAQRNVDSSVATSKVNPNYPGSHEWLTTASAAPSERRPSATGSSKGSDRVWLEPDKSEENLDRSGNVPLECTDAAAPAEQQLHGSVAPSHKVEHDAGRDECASAAAEERKDRQSESPEDGIEPTSDDFELASRVYHGDESLVDKAKAAAWLGDEGPERARVREAFMNKFEWQNMNILAALRDFCARILLKGETQQVDRLLDAFAYRWCICNANHGFKAKDVVHTICYSLLLLNTDLHMAEIEAKMTRVQFLKNTMPTIRRVVLDAAPDAFESKRASTLPPTIPWLDSPVTEQPKEATPGRGRSSTEGKRSFEGQRPVYRLSTRPSDQSPHAYSSSSVLTPLDYDIPTDDCGPLVKAPFRGKMSTWEVQVEIVLKNFYNSIRQQRLPLHMTETREPIAETAMPVNTLSAMTGSMLRRTPSMLSKAGSEHLSFRGRALEQRFATGRWTSKSRQRPRLYPASTVGSSRTSLEEQQSSMWSPAGSSTWSKYSFGRTQTSMSVDSFGSSFPEGEYQQSIGFANALSQAIIREEAGTFESAEETMRAAPLLEDESLELAGAPWAKEGILKHKHHLEAVDKKCKDRNWAENFAVIEKGCMRLFSFSMNAKSMRQKMRSQKLTGGVVGGGNWMDSAEALGQFSLRQTLASALPPPGYSKSRPHVWALSLPSGAVHLFQVGTPEIVKEFVTTANYWSARLSKEPLIGGISNIEYGWSEPVINAALLQNDAAQPATTTTGRPSLQSSIRSSLDQGSSRPKLPGDKVVVNDWMPPQQSMVASVLMEVDQLRALTTYVKNVENELQKHNELRPAMLLAVSFHSSLRTLPTYSLLEERHTLHHHLSGC